MLESIKTFLKDLKFNDIQINKRINDVNADLKKYIQEKILPKYELL